MDTSSAVLYPSQVKQFISLAQDYTSVPGGICAILHSKEMCDCLFDLRREMFHVKVVIEAMLMYSSDVASLKLAQDVYFRSSVLCDNVHHRKYLGIWINLTLKIF